MMTRGNGNCNKCGKDTKYYRVKNRNCYECGNCGNQVFPKSTTIFEKSRTPLKKWFTAIYFMSAYKNGVSAKSLERTLGVTYKTAWKMKKAIQLGLLDCYKEKMNGMFEMDETLIGGKKRCELENKVGYNGRENKTMVFGILNKGGKVRTLVVESNGGDDLLPIIDDFIEKGSTIYTDELPTYKVLKENYRHRFVNHSKFQWKKGKVTTNRIEGYWSLIKRKIRGTHIHVSKKWLWLYLSEFDFFYNNKKLNTFDLFKKMLETALNGESINHHPTYKERLHYKFY
jgi:transposase-like protein